MAPIESSNPQKPCLAKKRAGKMAIPLLAWYKKNARDLPWRGTKKPYPIWVSEIMLQQTQVKTALPYWARFMEEFPSVESLAKASEQKVLAVWQGLGYYRRAHNLHKASKLVVSEGFPDSEEGWKKLPGIGNYTAAAIHGFTSRDRTVVVDGNVVRVMCRYFGIQQGPGAARDKKVYQMAEWSTPKKAHEVFNQAIMEIGALVCTPRQPNCVTCPLKNLCLAYQSNLVDQLPVPLKKKSLPTLFGKVIWVIKDKQVLLHHRVGRSLWPGLYEPMGISVDRPAGNPVVPRQQPKIPGCPNQLPHIKHQFSHFHLNLEAQLVLPTRNIRVKNPYCWFGLDKLPPLPAPYKRSLNLALKFLSKKTSTKE